MTASTEDLARRVEKLERLLGEADMGEHASEERDDLAQRFWRRIPFSGWLKISGPTFALMALGFGLLWDAQQETTQRILDLQDSTTSRILAVQQETADKILAAQQETSDKILASQRETTARILEVQERIMEMQESTADRLLDMQQQILDLQRETRAGRS